ncbi:MAG: EAL domain-containing protein [Acidiferrobacterales bacterium]
MNQNSRISSIHAFIKFIRLDSIRSRIIFASVIFIVLLFVAAYFSSALVSRTNTASALNTFERQTTLALLTEITDAIWRTETTLQQYLIDPNDTYKVEIITTLDELISTLPELNLLSFYEDTANNDQIIILLDTYIKKLNRRVNDVIEIRKDNKAIYPAASITSKIMAPINTEFLKKVTESIENTKIIIEDIQKNTIKDHFHELKQEWLVLTSSFDHLAAIKNNLKRIELFDAVNRQKLHKNKQADIIQVHLDILTSFQKNKFLSNSPENSLDKLKSLVPVWLKYHQQVMELYLADKKRKDLALMKQEVLPLFKQIWITINLLTDNIVEFTSKDITAMRETSGKLSDAIWLIAFIGALITILGLLIYEYAVIRPITNVSKALNAEATGMPVPELSISSASEINDLVTAFSVMRSKVNSRQQRLQAIFDNAAEGIVTANEHGIIDQINNAAEKLFLYSAEDVVGKNISILVPEPHAGLHDKYMNKVYKNDSQGFLDRENEVMGKRSDGTVFPMSLKVSKVELEGRIIFSALVSDISERKAMMEHLKNIAERDTLTGLRNRYIFQIELDRVVHEARRGTNMVCAVLYIDLDNFKYINDTLGHAAGDRLLTEVADILGKRTRRSDLISRFGGDEFTLLIYDTNFNAAKNIAEDYQANLSSHIFHHKGIRYDISCSIGVALISNKTKNADEVLSQADFSCHLAKTAGKNCVHMFNPESESEITTLSKDISWSRKIRDAIDNDEFFLYFQPVINSTTLSADYFEVLIRLRGENNETIMPTGFIRTAERFGLAPDIDKWVIGKAIAKLAQYHIDNPDIKFAINLSGKSVSETGVLSVIQQAIEKTGVNPEAIIFEVTETAAIADLSAARHFLTELRAMGCQTAIDDFGAGMSSFTYLQDLPVDVVKIDGSFVHNLDSNPVNLALVQAMNNIAHALGCKTVIEHVSKKADFEAVSGLDIDYYQGYYFQKPGAAPLYEVKKFVDKKSG